MIITIAIVVAHMSMHLSMCFLLISVCVSVSDGVSGVFMPRHVSRAIDAGFAAKPLRGALRIILREVMQVAAVHSKGALTH